MSLINQMLKDLEERRNRQPPAAQSLRGVQVLDDTPRPGRKVQLLLLTMAAATISGWFFIRAAPTPSAPVAVRQPAARQPVPPSPPLVAHERSRKNVVPLSASAVSGTKTLAPAADQPSGEQAPEVRGVSSPAPVTSSPEESPSPSVAASEKTMEGKAVVAVPVPVAPPSAKTGPGEMTKTPHPLSPREEADMALRQGVAAAARNRPGEAEGHWRRALALDRDHLPAREALIELMLRQGRIGEAAAELQAGLQTSPDHAPFRRGHARLLLDRGAAAEALLTLLSGSMPSVREDPDYHSLLAASYQKAGQYAAAAETYRSLVAERPGAGTWWVGLGIALEGDGRVDEAAAAYRQALAIAGLPSQLKQFATERLAMAPASE